MIHLALCLAAAGFWTSAAQAADRDIVSVNGTIIRQSEVGDRLWKRYGPNTLDEMIDELLLRQAAQAKGLKPESGEVDKRLAKIKAQFNDAAVFANQLKQSGSSEEKLKADLSQQVLMRELIVSVNKISVGEEELKKSFEKHHAQFDTPPAVHLRHIVVKTEAEANEILAKVKAGSDFKALARQRSLAPTGKISGGDYGFISQGMLPEEIDKIAFAMKPGELRTVPSPKGWHVLQVVAKKPSKPAQYAAVKDDLKDALLEEKMKTVLPDYLQELRRKADIKPLGSID